MQNKIELLCRLSILALLIFNFLPIGHPYSAYANIQFPQGPIINDPKLKAEVVFRGLKFPTSMAFLGPNDILVLEKNDGTVRRIVNGTMLPDPVLEESVDNQAERGMLGIAVTKNKNLTTGLNTTFAFLYYTENITTPVFKLNFENNQSHDFQDNVSNLLKNCRASFRCTVTDPLNAKKDDNNSNRTSFQISTNTTNKNTWSFIYGNEISVNPREHYQLVSHMKLNQFVIGSHIVMQGYNDTSNKWRQISQCPSGTNGPLEWKEYSCEITIPANTTKIRPVLNAGWSSQPGKEAVTLFDAINVARKYTNNRLYRYELINNKLVNYKLLVNLPASSIFHNGGKVTIGPDKNVYVVVGDLDENTRAVNVINMTDEDGTGGILRVTQDGKPVGKGILGDEFPLNLYYAYGIRNSFGLDFDPITKKLWDTENGPRYGDEINLVEPGFNSGWKNVQGIWKVNGDKDGPVILTPQDLVDFGGKGKYRAPEFTWYQPAVGPTGIKFLNSDKLGKQYQDDMFVGDFHLGNLYHFKLNQHRTGLALNGTLASKISANSSDTATQSIVFGHGFGGITDVQVGPDGYLYILSLYQGGNNCVSGILGPCIKYNSSLPGTIFRIIPNS